MPELLSFKGVHHMVLDAINQCDIDIKKELFSNIILTGGNSLLSGFYIICMGLLAFHLRHGFESAFRSLGFSNQKYHPIISMVGFLFWIGLDLMR